MKPLKNPKKLGLLAMAVIATLNLTTPVASQSASTINDDFWADIENIEKSHHHDQAFFDEAEPQIQ